MYKPGDKIVITCPFLLHHFDGLIESDKGEIIEMIPKGKLTDYYYKIKSGDYEMTIGIPEFELDVQYYREDRLNKILK